MKENKVYTVKGGIEVREFANMLNKNMIVEWTRFNYCNAYISNLIGDNYRLIKSYNTIVGLVDIKNNTMYEFGKYSRTTSKQCSQIYNAYYRNWSRVNTGVTNW